MNRMMFYKEELDRNIEVNGCSTPGCDCRSGPMRFHALCHPSAGITISYADGVLDIFCRECNKLILGLILASRRGIEPSVN